jgi:hypothetical protein
MYACERAGGSCPPHPYVVEGNLGRLSAGLVVATVYAGDHVHGMQAPAAARSASVGNGGSEFECINGQRGRL